MDDGAIAQLRTGLVGRQCVSAELIGGYPCINLGDGKSIRIQCGWRLTDPGAAQSFDIPGLTGRTLAEFEVRGDQFDLRLLWDSGFVLATEPQAGDEMYERWIAHLGPMLLVGAGPGNSWFSFL
jgi:hypothetical protein